MVTKNKKNGEKKTRPAMPSGMKLVTPAEGDPNWFKPCEGAVVYGRLLGVFDRTIGEGYYFQIRILETVKAIRGRGDEAKTVDLVKGDVLNVDGRSALVGLKPLAESDGVFNVWIHCIEKVPIQGGKTFWRMEVAQETLKPPSKAVEVDYAEDIPF